jgi:hypothetical protein
MLNILRRMMPQTTLVQKGAYFLHIAFDIPKHVVCVQIVREIWHKTKAVTNVNQWTGIR